jgi:hypothetical protein
MKKSISLSNGIREIVVSPSYLFSLLVLFVISWVTWKQPSVGAAALAAFCTVVPALLTIAEHREQLQINQIDATTPPPPPARGQL